MFGTFGKCETLPLFLCQLQTMQQACERRSLREVQCGLLERSQLVNQSKTSLVVLHPTEAQLRHSAVAWFASAQSATGQPGAALSGSPPALLVAWLSAEHGTDKLHRLSSISCCFQVISINTEPCCYAAVSVNAVMCNWWTS